MLLNNKISSTPEPDPALDQQQLYAIGLDRVRRLSGGLWTDHNLHDPGITTLELLCYALTDLTYRARFSIADLLATQTDNADTMAKQFFTPRRILPNRPLTTNDYRKLLIDIKGVRNAWIQPAKEQYFVDTINNGLSLDDPRGQEPARKGIRQVDLRGLYNVLLDLDETPGTEPDVVKAEAVNLLRENRNLCEDFVSVEVVKEQYYILCTELELMPDADQNKVAARIQFEIERYLAPPVLNYGLADMLQRTHEDGTPWTVAEIFEGPPLQCGFIDDAELEKAGLRTEIRLSDIISIVMDIEGVRAVRDILINPLHPGNDPDDKAAAPANKWRIAVPAGRQPRLSDTQGRLVCYKRDVPVLLDRDKFLDEYQKLKSDMTAKLDKKKIEDLPIPPGRFRGIGSYQSFQHHFPVLYGLSGQGVPTGADEHRKALALQLKGYLLFFDQVMANYLAQLSSVRELFSRNPAVDATYFAQMVDTFPDASRIYATGITQADLAALLEDNAAKKERRSRLLDHLLSRFAEDVRHHAGIMRSAFGADADSLISLKSGLLENYPELGGERSLAYDYAPMTGKPLWNSPNVSGLERRIARLLDIENPDRRDLSGIHGGEGMYLIENILLRPRQDCEKCSVCADHDPYSYRLHFILPAYAGRFSNMDFRRHAEDVIRAETPAHILPKVCWISADDMKKVESAYRDWIQAQAGGAGAAGYPDKLHRLASTLSAIKNVYPSRQLNLCVNDTGDNPPPPFILGNTSLGSESNKNSPDN